QVRRHDHGREVRDPDVPRDVRLDIVATRRTSDHDGDHGQQAESDATRSHENRSLVRLRHLTVPPTSMASAAFLVRPFGTGHPGLQVWLSVLRSLLPFGPGWSHPTRWTAPYGQSWSHDSRVPGATRPKI